MAREGFLIIGYGSPLRGDDAAGPIAARQLAQQGFHALDVHQLTPELAEPVAKARMVPFIKVRTKKKGQLLQRHWLVPKTGTKHTIITQYTPWGTRACRPVEDDDCKLGEHLDELSFSTARIKKCCEPEICEWN